MKFPLIQSISCEQSSQVHGEKDGLQGSYFGVNPLFMYSKSQDLQLKLYDQFHFFFNFQEMRKVGVDLDISNLSLRNI